MKDPRLSNPPWLNSSNYMLNDTNASITNRFQPIPIFIYNSISDSILLPFRASVCKNNDRWFDENQLTDIFKIIYKN